MAGESSPSSKEERRQRRRRSRSRCCRPSTRSGSRQERLDRSPPEERQQGARSESWCGTKGCSWHVLKCSEVMETSDHHSAQSVIQRHPLSNQFSFQKLCLTLKKEGGEEEGQNASWRKKLLVGRSPKGSSQPHHFPPMDIQRCFY